MDNEPLFYELIRLAIGSGTQFSRLPSAEGWHELYSMAERQSLVGVCFYGVKMYIESVCSYENFENTRILSDLNLPQDLYYDWMSATFQIENRNEVINRHCVELNKISEKYGLRSSVLKGQGIALLYLGDLKRFRQSGDIDLLVESDYKGTAQFASTFSKKALWAYKHFHLDIYDDTLVELHIRSGLMFNPFNNRKWQKWSKDNSEHIFRSVGSAGFSAPDNFFNSVYILQHCYIHLLESGVGLRQLMDYYFVLKTSHQIELQESRKVIEMLGMHRFASGIMWIMKEVFGLEEKHMIFAPDCDEGAFLLKEIMHSGNFGKYDNRFESNATSKRKKLLYMFKRTWLLRGHYPQETLWMPWYFVWHFLTKLFHSILSDSEITCKS